MTIGPWGIPLVPAAVHWSLVHVERVQEPGPEWDRFVEAMPGAALGHAAAWAAILREAYALTAHYLAVRDAAGALAGVLPLVCFRSWRGRRELVSLPFLDTGGILANSRDAESALLEGALSLARELRAQAIELRQPKPLSAGSTPSFLNRLDLVLPLATDEQAQWKALGPKVRNQTRKAEREGLRIAEGRPDELAKEFYEPFRVNMRDLGSPAHAKRFFRAAAQGFGERLRFIVTRLGERPVGGLVAIRYAGGVTVPWAATLRTERHRCPNNLIYWEALRWAVGEGAGEFDFGRSRPGSGTHRFKLGWGALERPLAWTRVDPQGRTLDAGGVDDIAILKKLSVIWSHLPAPVTDLLGPRVRRFLSN